MSAFDPSGHRPASRVAVAKPISALSMHSFEPIRFLAEPLGGSMMASGSGGYEAQRSDKRDYPMCRVAHGFASRHSAVSTDSRGSRRFLPRWRSSPDELRASSLTRKCLASLPRTMDASSALTSSANPILVRGVGPIAVDPAAQAGGIGRRLMEAILQRAGGLPTRLLQETFNMRSMSLYASLGFEVKDLYVLVSGRPSVQHSECEVRPMTESDLDGCERLQLKAIGFSRINELRTALKAGTPWVAVRNGDDRGIRRIAVPVDRQSRCRRRRTVSGCPFQR